MKTIALSIFCLLITSIVLGDDAKDKYGLNSNTKDTVEIIIGENSKIVIIVDSQKDLEQLKEYDINGMLKDLNMKIEKNEDREELVIEDNSGKRYLKDTTIVYEESEFEEMEEEFEEAFEDSGDEFEEEEYEYEYEYEYEEETYENRSFNKSVFRGQRTKHRTVIDFGMNNYLMDGDFPDESNQPFTVKPFGSWYIALGPTFQTHVGGKLSLEWGANVSWYNFKYQDPAQLIMQDEEGLYWVESTNPNPVKSKLTVTYINASFVPMLDFGYKKRVERYNDGSVAKYLNYDKKSFRIGFGGYAGYKIDSYSKFVYKDDGKNKDHDKNSYYLENVRYGARLVLGYDDFDFFVNYDLNSLFHEDRGPDLNAFSFGLSF